VVGRHLDALGRYPDPAAATAALAAAIGVAPERVLLTNGGAEAIALVAAEQGRGWVEEPEFSLYRRHLARLDPTGPSWRSNPRTPGGLLAAPDEVAGVWDEAFYPLATGSWTRGDAERGAVVVGSLTKLLACPGLRLGYVLGDEALVAALRGRQACWSVGALAAEALPELLAAVDLPGWARCLAELRGQLVALLSAHGLSPLPSEAPWVLVEEAWGLRDTLAAEGVLVRDCASFGLAGTVRLAVPGPEGLARLDRALGPALAGGRAR
jgi:histidinol-phosphate/aromatic aminotransferase/cobyric acid decarboxylase-like protein